MSTEATAAAEKKTCLHCSAPLRSSNTRGICRECSQAQKPDLNGFTLNQVQYQAKRKRLGRGGDLVSLPRKSLKPPPKRKGELSALEQFRIIANAIRPSGMGADELIEQFAKSFVEKLREAAEKADDDGE